MKKIYMIAIASLSTHGTLSAQNNTVATGGDAIGSGGSSSYSIGQPFYQIEEGGGFSVTQGLQQPIEIVPLGKTDFVETNPNIKIHPNPAFSGFYIALPQADYDHSDYVLFDINGKTVRKGEITSEEIFVSADGMVPGVYLLKINSPGKDSNFKIIKR